MKDLKKYLIESDDSLSQEDFEKINFDPVTKEVARMLGKNVNIEYKLLRGHGSDNVAIAAWQNLVAKDFGVLSGFVKHFELRSMGKASTKELWMDVILYLELEDGLKKPIQVTHGRYSLSSKKWSFR